MNKKSQLCFIITPAAYSELNELVRHLKDRDKQWNNSAVLNVLIRQSKANFEKLSDKKLKALLEQYAEWRG